jgi:hypothetical protein
VTRQTFEVSKTSKVSARNVSMPNTNSTADPYGALREQSHERFYLLWQQAKLGAELEGDDARLVQAMRDHPEYYDTWEHANEFLQEQVTVNGANPFLHVTMHSVVENQAAQNEPPEVCAVLQYKILLKTPRHQAVHEIANAFTEQLWVVLHDRKHFDQDAYRRSLAKMLPRSKR